MNVNNDRLTKEELQFLIEKLSLLNDDPAESADTLLEFPVQGTPQTDLKERLQRSVNEMRAQNEEVPANLLALLDRL